MVQGQVSDAARGREAAQRVARRLLAAASRRAVRGDAQAAQRTKRRLVSAAGRDAVRGRGGVQAATSSGAAQRDLNRFGTPFAGVSVVTGGKLCPSTTSAINSGRARGYHLLVVEGYARAKDTPNGEGIMSRPFIVGGRRWCIEYFPNDQCCQFGDFMSLFVVLDDNIAKAVEMQFEFSFIDQAEKQKPTHILATKKCSFSGYHDNWGGRFIKRDILEKSKNLKDDCLTIRCDIIVTEDPEDASGTEALLPDMHQHLNHLLETKVGADVTFEVGGEAFAAHRCVLAARSTVFMAELFGPMKEGAAASIIQIKDMEAKVFSALLTFIYTDSIPLMEMDNMEEDQAKDEEDVQEYNKEVVIWVQWCQHLLVAADRYDLQQLKFICEEQLLENIENIGVSTVTSTLALAEQHHCHGLKEACLDFLKCPNNLKEVLAADGLDHITRNCPSILKELLSKFAS